MQNYNMAGRTLPDGLIHHCLRADNPDSHSSMSLPVRELPMW